MSVFHGVAAATAMLILCGCADLQKMMDGQGPSVRPAGVRITSLGLQEATLAFDLDLTNPYDNVPLPLTNMGYALSSGGKQFLSGQANLQGTVPPRSTQRMTLPLTLSYTGLLHVLQAVKPGEVIAYETQLAASVQLPAWTGGGTRNLPLTYKGKLPIPAAPRVELKQLRWQTLSMDNATAVLSLGIGNTNKFGVDLSRLSYALSLAGSEVAKASLTQGLKLDAGATGELEIPLSFSPAKLGLAGLRLLSGKDAGYRLQGMVNLGSPFGPLELPFDHSGQVSLQRP